MYNPPETGNDSLEFIELYNSGSYVVNLQNYAFTSGIDHVFGDTAIFPGQYLILAQNSGAFFNTFGTNVMSWNSGRLTNSGELITLVDQNGLVVDAVEYGITAPWPSLPNGQGPSLTLCNPWSDNSNPANWSAATHEAALNGAGQIIFADPATGCPTWSGAPVANFYTTTNNMITGSMAVFQDVSAGNPASWVWSFPGGLPASSTQQQPPAIHYPAAGNYPVCLTVSNNAGTHQHCETNYIVVSDLPDIDVVITEIMYNPPGSTDSLEYIELYNQGSDTAFLDGYYFGSGITFAFPMVSIAPNEYLVITTNAPAFYNTFGTTALQWTSGFLSNSGEPLVLKDDQGTTIDSVFYGTLPPWPAAANGSGPSLVLCDPSLDNALAENWILASEPAAINTLNQTIYGTPGGPCAFSVPIPGFAANQTTIPAGASVQFTDLSTGYIASRQWTFEGGTPATSAVENPAVVYGVAGTFRVCLKVQNVYGADSLCIDHYITVNTNGAGDLVITEIMYNPPETTDTLEYIELYNRSDDTISLSGYQITEGITHTFGQERLAPGDFLVLARNSEAIGNTFNIAAIQWQDGILNNAGELLLLKDPFGLVVDSVHYLPTLPWDPGANGNGPSLVMCDPMLDNAVGSNWIRSTDTAAQNLAGDVVYGTPGGPCQHTIPQPQFSVSQTVVGVGGEVEFSDLSGGYVSGRNWTFEGGTPPISSVIKPIVKYHAQGVYKVCLRVSNIYGTDSLCREEYIQVVTGPDQKIVITEIMYNSPDANTDSLEFIELYNNSGESIDLAGYRFSAGVSFTFPPYEFDPGTFVVIARDSVKSARFYGTPFLQWSGGELQNSGETIRLVDPLGIPMDSVTYGAAPPWDALANGLGHSLVLCNPMADNSLAESWYHAFDTAGQIANGKYVLANPGRGCNLATPQAAFTASNTYLFPGEETGFTDLSAGNPTAWKWYLEGAIPPISIQQHPTQILYPEAGNYTVCLKVSNAAGSDSLCRENYIRATPGGSARIAISEIMYNPPDVLNDTLEFIELTNVDTLETDLRGFRFTAGVAFEFPHTMLLPGGKAVIARDSERLFNLTGVTAFQWNNGESLANFGETIILTDRLGYIVDSLSYRPSLPWPVGTDGTGRAITLCDPTLDNSDPANWIAAYDIAGFKPNGDTLWGTPGSGCGPSAPIIRIASSSRLIPTNEPVTYFAIDLAWPSTSWLWEFESAGTDSGFVQNPEVTYPEKGIFSVKLTTSNNYGNATTYASNYMTVVEGQGIADNHARFVVWPNPNDGIFSLQTPFPATTVEIYNSTGQLVEKRVTTANLELFNFSEMPAGMYFVRLSHPAASSGIVKIIRK